MLLSSPTFRKVWIKRAGGPTTTVTAPGASAGSVYVRSAELDGRTWTRSWVPSSLLNRGGKLEIRVGARPNKDWGSSPQEVPQDR
jgi:putative alpha-1,2-mannosidase